MGNTTSTQRADFLQRDDRRFRELVQERGLRSENPQEHIEQIGAAGRNRSSSPRPLQPLRSRSRLYNSIRRRSRAQGLVDRDEGRRIITAHEIQDQDEQEERPLVGSTDMDPPNNTSATTIGSSLSRSPSTMSRLGTRLLPDSVVRGLFNSGEETPAEGRALRWGNRVPEGLHLTQLERPLSQETTDRLSLRGSLRGSLRARLPGRAAGPPVSRQVARASRRSNGRPLDYDFATQLDDNTINRTSVDRLRDSSTSWRRRIRLNGVRNSLHVQHIFGASADRGQQIQPSRNSTSQPSRLASADDSDQLLLPLSNVDHRMEVDDAPHELDAIEPETRNILSSARGAQASSSLRRFPHALRSRSTRLIRRGEHPPLSQVLQLAATAIAAQLSGLPNPTGSGARALGGEPFDGTIQNFVQTLQEAATAQAGETLNDDMANGNLPPVNFMRVFQFPNNDNFASGSDQNAANVTDPMELDDRGADGNDRSVTLVLVGVRSMPTTGEDDTGNVGPSLDTLLSLPFLPPTNVLRNGSSGALFRRSDGRSRLGARRNSMTNFNSFPAQYESQRHQRTRSNANRSSSDHVPLTAAPTTSVPTILSESPPGPHPPPSTPADPRSGAGTPSRRPSSASAVQAPALPNLLENPTERPTTDSTFSTARQRRRSDSEFARRPELSSGASRRNGVVEPDTPPQPTGRSWLIYVVGTNVSPDHPAFTMPSLFTDNPSYEDMQLLSALLGPAKPPVASAADVSSAGGIFRLVERGGSLIAEPIQGQADTGLVSMAIVDGDRCLICLCDYEAAEEVRQLNKCRHVYHRECVDEWLTTGRNSCPMCRGQGVDEKAVTDPQQSAPPQPAEVE